MGEDMFPWEEEEHYYRHRVEVHLALAAVNAADSSKTRFAIKSNTPSLPYKVLPKDGSCFEMAKQIFKELTGSDADPWFIIKQVGVMESVTEDAIIVLYSILIPELVPIIDKTVGWVDFDELSKHPALLCMVGTACNFYKSA